MNLALITGSYRFNKLIFYANYHQDVLQIAVDKMPAASSASKDSLTKDDWFNICKNPYAKDVIEANKDNIDWSGLSLNDSEWAYELLMQNPDKIDLECLFMNRNPKWFDMIKEHLNKLDEEQLLDLMKEGYESWKLPLFSDKEMIDRVFPYRNESDDDHDVQSFLVNVVYMKQMNSQVELDFLERWFNEEKYYTYISMSSSIFIE